MRRLGRARDARRGPRRPRRDAMRLVALVRLSRSLASRLTGQCVIGGGERFNDEHGQGKENSAPNELFHEWGRAPRQVASVIISTRRGHLGDSRASPPPPQAAEGRAVNALDTRGPPSASSAP